MIDEPPEDEGDGDKPFTLEEFMAKAMQKIENTKNSMNKPQKKTGGKPKKK